MLERGKACALFTLPDLGVEFGLGGRGNLCCGKFKMVKSLRRGWGRGNRAAHSPGEMAEWLKAHAWKACVPQGTVGSNPTLSAMDRVGGVKPNRPRHHENPTRSFLKTSSADSVTQSSAATSCRDCIGHSEGYSGFDGLPNHSGPFRDSSFSTSSPWPHA